MSGMSGTWVVGVGLRVDGMVGGCREPEGGWAGCGSGWTGRRGREGVEGGPQHAPRDPRLKIERNYDGRDKQQVGGGGGG